MDREILFRGKRADNGEWIYGNLFIPDNPDKPVEILIGTNSVRISYEVIPETVGQYTGLTDKNGTKIFEGDIIFRNYYGEKKTYQVVYDKYIGAFTGQDKEGLYYTTFDGDSECFEVIDNIHDNPELINQEG